MQRKPGLVYTFYSYKGGVGRSMALANVAALLAKWGIAVLIVDWDLEASGIESFFEGVTPWLRDLRRTKPRRSRSRNSQSGRTRDRLA